MCVHGIPISAIARIKTIAWGTVSRWLELAAMFAERFNHQKLRSFIIHELQADEIRTFVGDKEQVVWILTALEVWSRLWISVIVGRRNYRNVKAGILDVLQWGLIKHRFLFTTDGFEMYEWAVKRLLAGVCIYGQVIKKRRENRVIRVNRKLILGTKAELDQALFNSEDSKTLNTSFVERHNLTIRQGCSYLGRRTPSHARQSKSLTGQMALMMLYYNFVRPHMALKFGRFVKTPAMQAGLAAKRISFREVFTDFFLFFFFADLAKKCRFGFARSWFASWRIIFILTTLPWRSTGSSCTAPALMTFLQSDDGCYLALHPIELLILELLPHFAGSGSSF
jgi:IS1 family transposase